MEVAGGGRSSVPRASSRSSAEVEHHYRVELELAQRLRMAPRDERLRLYGAVYDELFQRVP